MRTLRIVLFIPIAWIAMADQTAQAEQPALTSGRGVVVSAGSNLPLTKANVELRSINDSTVIARIVTDLEGQFFLKNIPAGSYRLIVSRDGYIRSEYGQKHPGGPPLNL